MEIPLRKILFWLLLVVSGGSFIVLYDVFNIVVAVQQRHVKRAKIDTKTVSKDDEDLLKTAENLDNIEADLYNKLNKPEAFGTTENADPNNLNKPEVFESMGEVYDNDLKTSGVLDDDITAAFGKGQKKSGDGASKRPGTIVYSCNKISVCGGWADRQKGVVSAFVLSAMMGRHFKLDMPRPCDVSVYLAPNEVDWVLKPGEVDTGTRSDVEGIDSHGYDLVKRMMRFEHLSISEFEADYVFITWNMELVHQLRAHPLARSLHWLSEEKSLSEIYHHVLTKLFKPTDLLASKMTHLQDSRPPGIKMACAQIRLGGSPQFKDSETFNSMDGVRKLFDHLRAYDHPNKYRILLASDNVQALKLGRETFPETFMETSGPVTHVDKYRGEDACAGFGRAILDQLVLSTCDVLIISESGLGKIAAFLRNTDDDLFLFHNSQISVFRRDLPFPNRLFW